MFLLFYCFVPCFHCCSVWFCVSTVLLPGSVFPLFLCMALCFHCSSVWLCVSTVLLSIWSCASTVYLSGSAFLLFFCLVLSFHCSCGFVFQPQLCGFFFCVFVLFFFLNKYLLSCKLYCLIFYCPIRRKRKNITKPFRGIR